MLYGITLGEIRSSSIFIIWQNVFEPSKDFSSKLVHTELSSTQPSERLHGSSRGSTDVSHARKDSHESELSRMTGSSNQLASEGFLNVGDSQDQPSSDHCRHCVFSKPVAPFYSPLYFFHVTSTSKQLQQSRPGPIYQSQGETTRTINASSVD